MEFDDVVVDFFEAAKTAGSLDYVSDVVAPEPRDLPSVPARPKNKAHRLNQDYDAWTAAQPGPIFEKEI